jgi:hypothetical protein
VIASEIEYTHHPDRYPRLGMIIYQFPVFALVDSSTLHFYPPSSVFPNVAPLIIKNKNEFAIIN